MMSECKKNNNMGTTKWYDFIIITKYKAPFSWFNDNFNDK